MSKRQREVKVSAEVFRQMLAAKYIRPASLEDCNGTHHQRALYRHPNTGDWFVAVTAEKANV